MAAAALPAPTTTSRPRGRDGRCGGTQRWGSPAATPASNKLRRKRRGSRLSQSSPMGSLGVLEHLSQTRPTSGNAAALVINWLLQERTEAPMTRAHALLAFACVLAAGPVGSASAAEASV